MAFHTITIMDIWEVLCRPPWADQSICDIAKSLGYDRKTIHRYIRLALAKGLTIGAALPPSPSRAR